MCVLSGRAFGPHQKKAIGKSRKNFYLEIFWGMG